MKPGTITIGRTSYHVDSLGTARVYFTGTDGSRHYCDPEPESVSARIRERLFARRAKGRARHSLMMDLYGHRNRDGSYE